MERGNTKLSMKGSNLAFELNCAKICQNVLDKINEEFLYNLLTVYCCNAYCCIFQYQNNFNKKIISIKK